MPTRPLVTSYRQSLKLFPDLWHKVGLVIIAFCLLYYPFYVGEKWLMIGNSTLVAVVGALALMTLTGFAGQISLGHAAFLSIGAYTGAILGNHFQLPFWLLIPLGGIVSTIIGLSVGTFALRLKGLYLAIVTIGLVFIVEHCVLSFEEYTKATSLLDFPIHTWFGDNPDAFLDETTIGPLTLSKFHKTYFIFLVIAFLVTYAIKNIHRSNAGRAMMAVRDHDLAASALGVNPAKAKIMAFGISSFFAGVAGVMYAMHADGVSHGTFNLNVSIEYIAMIVLGGIGSVFGAIVGAIAIILLRPLSENLASYIPYLDQLPEGQQSAIIFSTIVIIFLVLEPLGLFGIWLRIKRYFLAWPFRY